MGDRHRFRRHAIDHACGLLRRGDHRSQRIRRIGDRSLSLVAGTSNLPLVLDVPVYDIVHAFAVSGFLGICKLHKA